MAVLERETQLKTLLDAVAAAAEGRGRTVLVTGEAGIGKTSLVEQFTDGITNRARVLWGACEALFAPRALGPLHDIAHRLGGPLLVQLQNDARPIDLFHALLEQIRHHHQPSVIVIEDAHWGDHATLDLIRFLARRISKVPGVFVLTYRDDEVGADHPLTPVLGEMPSATRERVGLVPLSLQAVGQLAIGTNRDGRDLYRLTGGNPFFVTEMLRAGECEVAPSVRELVLARARNLSTPARALLDRVSIVPDRLEQSLLDRFWTGGVAALGECIDHGLLRLHDGRVAFRHELARLAIEGALPAALRMQFNLAMVKILSSQEGAPTGTARIAHHALAAFDADAIVRYVPVAAAAATKNNAHREAARLLAAAVPYAGRMPSRDRAEFYEQRSLACSLISEGLEATAMSEAAYRLWDELDDAWGKGRNLIGRGQIDLVVRHARVDESIALAEAALPLLEPFGATGEFVRALALTALRHAGSAPKVAAILFRAAEMASKLPAGDHRVDALLIVIGMEFYCFGAVTASSLARLESEAREIDHRRGVMAHMFYVTHASARARDLNRVIETIDRCEAYASENDLDLNIHAFGVRRFRADVHAARGEWADAMRVYREIEAIPGVPWFIQMVNCRAHELLIEMRLSGKVNEPEIAEIVKLEPRMTHYDRYFLHRVLVEIEWLAGNQGAAMTSAAALMQIGRDWEHPWAIGEATFWLRLLGANTSASPSLPELYGLLFAGDWRGAAAEWRQRGYPYEAALAHVLGDAEALREAVRLFDDLGARCTARRVREQMRERGFAGIPRGPRQSTRANDAGLTDRERAVLDQLAEGLTNSEIAVRIHRSSRTVEHQVASVMGKLGVRTRSDAVAIARDRGLVEAGSGRGTAA